MMKHQLKTYNDKLLIELNTTEHGSEFYTTNEVKTLKDKLSISNGEHGLQFENDMSYLNEIHNYSKKINKPTDTVSEERFTEVSERWGLKYETI